MNTLSNLKDDIYIFSPRSVDVLSQWLSNPLLEIDFTHRILTFLQAIKERGIFDYEILEIQRHLKSFLDRIQQCVVAGTKSGLLGKYFRGNLILLPLFDMIILMLLNYLWS